MIVNFAVLIISSVIFFLNINSFPLRNWDEAWYAEISKNMASGNYSLLVPFWNGQYYFDKPPLYFWLSFPIIKIFGPGEWQARFVSTIAAVLGSFMVFLIAKKLFNKKVGIFAFIIFLTLGQVVERFSKGNLDSLLVALFTTSFYFYLVSKEKKWTWILCSLIIGLGFLVKGWLLGLFPLGAIFIYSLLVEKNLPRNFFKILFVPFIPYGIWLVLGFNQFGSEFIKWYLFNPSQGQLKQHSQFSLIYFETLARDIGFWFLSFVIWLLAIHKVSDKTENLTKIFPLATFATLFVLVASFGFDKLGWHILPAYPFLAIILGYFSFQVFNKYRLYGSLLIVIILVAQIFLLEKIENIHPDRSSVGAHLGVKVRSMDTYGETIILDGPDFSSFLYYSNKGRVFVTHESGPKQGEWWIIKRENFDDFIKNKKPILLITPNPEKFFSFPQDLEVIEEDLGYKFVKIK